MKLICFWIAFITASIGGLSEAQTVLPVPATSVALATTKDSHQLNYLVLDLPAVMVPTGMRLEEAYLELYVDASNTRSTDSASTETVTLEVYPYGGTSKGKLDTTKIGTSAMKRTVHVGTNKPVRVYVTDFVAAGIANHAADRHLIVGSVSGDRSAVFDAKTLPGTANTKATLTVFFTRSENAVSGQDAE